MHVFIERKFKAIRLFDSFFCCNLGETELIKIVTMSQRDALNYFSFCH